MNVYNLTFQGYWRDVNRKSIPSISGIYLVYKCKYNEDDDTVSLLEMLYIGQSINVNQRIDLHDKREQFFNKCDRTKGETLCYSVAEVKENDLALVENALIFAQKPELNENIKDSFLFDRSEFHLEGKCSLMKHTNFSIK